ncbi:MAG: amidase [Acidimicrobiales bacterium]
MSATWILRMDAPGAGPRVAIKDLIDVAGTPTTAACAVVARQAEPAERDAACMVGLRAADVAIVGKANLHELACGGTGINHHFGTPVNPFDPACIPGGSSSGSAVALADGEVDIALGSDTAGSIRNPSACCGTAGLKTTWGRVSLEGVWPLAPSLDTVGPMARDVAGVIEGMALLEPGFVAADASSPVIGRVRLPDIDPRIDAAVDAALAASELEVVEVDLPGWDAAGEAGFTVMFHEYWAVDHHLYEQDAAGLGEDIVERMEQGRGVTSDAYQRARAHRAGWRAELAAAFARSPVLAWPTLAMFPTRKDEAFPNTRRTGLPVNHAGHPSLALPVPAGGRFPTSVQLVGPDDSEDLLCATGLVVEAAARSLA